MRPIVAQKRNYTPLLIKRRYWYDIEGGGTEEQITEDDKPPVTPVPKPPKKDSLVNFDETDEEGRRLYFDRDYVSNLREESKGYRTNLEQVQSELERLQQEQTDRKTAELTEKEQFKELADTYRQELETLKSQYAQMEFSALQATIGSEYGLPQEIYERLRGESRDELVEDAQRLAALWVGKGRQQPKEPGSVTPTPGGPAPPARDDAARHSEYFGDSESSGIFKVDPNNLRFFGKDE